MLWHHNQQTDKVFRRCAGCKTCCNTTAQKRCQSNLQGRCYAYLSQLSTTLGHQGSSLTPHSEDDLHPVLQCMVQVAQRSAGSRSRSKGSILLCSEPTQTTKSEPLCLSWAARYHPTLEVTALPIVLMYTQQVKALSSSLHLSLKKLVCKF